MISLACGKILPAEFLCFRLCIPRGLLKAMNVADSIWDKLTRVVVFLLLLAVLAGIGRWYFPLIQENGLKRKEIDRLDDKVEKERETKKQLEGDIKALNDPKAVERLIRNELLYARPGETVFRFEEPPTNSASPR